MCTKIKVVAVVKEIETVGEFIEFVNNRLEKHNIDFTMEYIVLSSGYNTLYASDCLCKVDITATLKKLKMDYFFTGIDYLLGEDAFTLC